MRPLTEQDFDKMATHVVDQFMGGAKLAEVAAAEATRAQLTPDQIERLVQAANTMAFLRLLEEQKTHARDNGPDMTREFDPINASTVIQSILGSTHAPDDCGDTEAALAEVSLDDLDDADEDEGETADVAPMDTDNDGPFPKGAKQAQVEAGRPKKAAARLQAPDRLKQAAFADRRNRKLLGLLEDQYRQAEWSFEDGFAKLATALKYAHGAPTMADFEKDALALYPDSAGVAVLNMVRGLRDLAPVTAEYVRDKHASLVDRHIVDDNQAVQLFGQLVKIANRAAELQTAVKYLREQCC